MAAEQPVDRRPLCIAFAGLLAIRKVWVSPAFTAWSADRRRLLLPARCRGYILALRRDPLLFTIPIAVMALADTAAALVGRQVGVNHYRVFDNKRTVEGSLAFFGLAMAICMVDQPDRKPGWPAGVAIVAAIMARPRGRVRGADNLFIPYTCFLVLDRTLRLGLRDLSGWVEGMLLGAIILVFSFRSAALTPAGGITVFVVVSLRGPWGDCWLFLAAFCRCCRHPAQGRKIRADLDEVFPTTVVHGIVLTFGHFGDAASSFRTSRR